MARRGRGEEGERGGMWSITWLNHVLLGSDKLLWDLGSSFPRYIFLFLFFFLSFCSVPAVTK